MKIKQSIINLTRKARNYCYLPGFGLQQYSFSYTNAGFMKNFLTVTSFETISRFWNPKNNGFWVRVSLVLSAIIFASQVVPMGISERQTNLIPVSASDLESVELNERFSLRAEGNNFASKKVPVYRLKKMILSTIPESLKGRAEDKISFTILTAKKYNVDPFWALAIMWTESHFNQKAKSRVGARGLMQIMPATARHLKSQIQDGASKNKISQDKYAFVNDAKVNIELGVAYLKDLLRQFKGNYRYATMAYNMGPGRIKRRLRRKMEVGVKNLYLNKVVKHYKKLTKPFVSPLVAKN